METEIPVTVPCIMQMTQKQGKEKTRGYHA